MSKRILLAEDEPSTLLLITRALTKHGLEVEAVTDGQQALDAIRAHRPDLLILDLLMPVLDGWALLEVLQEDNTLKSLPVLVLSGAPKDGLQATKRFGVLFLVKPFDLPVLMAMIEYLTGIIEERARLQGALLAAQTLQHYIRNDLSLTRGYCEMLTSDPRLSESTRERAKLAYEGVEAACDKLDRLSRVTKVEIDHSLATELLAIPADGALAD